MEPVFDPLVEQWFVGHVGPATEIQKRAWPRIAAGEHVLAVAPTGSGKTLTAFLSALSALATGIWPTGRVSVVYVSPLKALGTDIRANLAMPLAGLRQAFAAAGRPFPRIRAMIRSGDTPQDERRRMVRHPPEILITTPESLSLLLASKGGRGMLGEVRLVILDEIHAVAATKRGAFLLATVERLALLAGEFQRVALSATVAPLETVAAMVGGFRRVGDPGQPALIPRPVTVVTTAVSKAYDIRVRHVVWPEERQAGVSYLHLVAAELRRIIAAGRTTLIFVNSRKLCEKLTRLINDDENGGLAHAHHGSLSRELRSAVEARLKAGELAAVVATNSLELGIDIGDVDRVVLVECPPTVSAGIQRIGRSGHGVGQVSRAVFVPTSERDLLEAAVMARAVARGAIEPLCPVTAPLDVLAQILVAMLGVTRWSVEALYQAVRQAWPYRDLSRTAFDLTLGMLAGRYAGTRIRELAPLVAIDAVDATAAARPGALLRLYASGGVIADRGYYALRRQDSGARLGELDEVFVWEARLGQIFAFGAQNWRIERITDADVFVSPAAAGTVPAPFWLGDSRFRDSHFSGFISDFLEESDVGLDDPGFAGRLAKDCFLEPEAAQALCEYLSRQKEATGTGLPHGRHLVVETTATGPGGVPGNQVILHAPLGLGVLAPLGLALESVLAAMCGHSVPVYAGNDCLAATLPGEADVMAALEILAGGDTIAVLRERLEGSGSFGAAFREAAGRALLLPRDGFGKRQPLWITRLRARKLLAAVAGHGDFPMVLEAWRTCLDDLFDVSRLRAFLEALRVGELSVSRVATRVQSPFAADIVWRHTTEYMYLTDAGTTGGATGVRLDLVAEVASSTTRPCVPGTLVADFAAKRQRLFPGYAPATPPEVLEYLKERVLVTEAQWQDVLAAVWRDHGLEGATVETALEARLARIVVSGGESFVVALERAGTVAGALYDATVTLLPYADGRELPKAATRRLSRQETEPGREALLVEWLSFYGPLRLETMTLWTGLGEERLQAVVEDLCAAGKWVLGPLVSGTAATMVCDAANFQILLRMARAARRPVVNPLPTGHVPWFLACWQGLANPAGEVRELAERLERLACLPLPAVLWETEVLPARCRSYDPAWLDAALEQTGFAWFGSGRERVLFTHPDDLDLAGLFRKGHVSELFPDPRARYDFAALLDMTDGSSAALAEALWRAAWRGEAACDALAVLRRGVATGFKAEPLFTGASRGGRRLVRRSTQARFAASLPMAGSWYRPRAVEPPDDPMEVEALAMDRARLLLERYGVVCRDMLVRELPALAWAGVFRALRRMELSGEVVSGVFFENLSGPQFATGQAVRLLTEGLTGDAPWWCAGRDPVALWGVGPDTGGTPLPRRGAGIHVAFAGYRPVGTVAGGGTRLELFLPPEDDGLSAALAPVAHLLSRRVAPEPRLAVTTINGQPSGTSPYLPALRQLFEVIRERRGITLFRRQGSGSGVAG